MAELTKTNEPHPEFGKILRLVYDDGVRVYLSNKGLTVSIPNEHEAVKRHKEKGYVSIIFNQQEIDLLATAIEWLDEPE